MECNQGYFYARVSSNGRFKYVATPFTGFYSNGNYHVVSDNFSNNTSSYN